MAYLKLPKTEAEIKKMPAASVRKEYLVISKDYQSILDEDVIRCANCGEWWGKKNYYSSRKYKTGIFPVCKKCILAKVEQRKKSTDEPHETKESVIDICREMDILYHDTYYETCCKAVESGAGDNVKKSPFLQYIVAIMSLPQYRGKTFADSEFPIELTGNKFKVKQSTIKRFGEGFTNSDYMFLQDEYEDWVSKYECNTKAQSELFERLCFKKLEIHKATLAGKSTKDLDESYQKLMNTANITPRQNSLDTLSEGQNFGQMIQRWEDEKPIPECDPELRDVDHIGQYIDVFYKGHMAKMLSLKNSLQNIYESFMKKFTVERPEYNEEEDSEELFDKIFNQNNQGA